MGVTRGIMATMPDPMMGGSVLQPVALENEIEEWFKHGGQGKEFYMFLFVFVVQTEQGKSGGEKYRCHYEAKKDGGCGVEAFVNLC